MQTGKTNQQEVANSQRQLKQQADIRQIFGKLYEINQDLAKLNQNLAKVNHNLEKISCDIQQQKETQIQTQIHLQQIAKFIQLQYQTHREDIQMDDLESPIPKNCSYLI